MSTFETILTIIGIVIIFFGICILPILLMNMINYLTDSFRRNRHPEYFQRYDAALTESFRISASYNAEIRHIKEKAEMWLKGYSEGECEKIVLIRRMNTLFNRYLKAIDDRAEKRKANELLWKEVNNYAIEHDLKWGIIDDD